MTSTKITAAPDLQRKNSDGHLVPSRLCMAYRANPDNTVNVSVTSVQISGPQNRSVEYIYPVYAQHPLHIY